MFDRKGNENIENPNLITKARLFLHFLFDNFSYHRLTKLKSVCYHNRFILDSRYYVSDARLQLEHFVARNSVKLREQAAESHRGVADESLHNSHSLGVYEWCQALLVCDDVYLRV